MRPIYFLSVVRSFPGRRVPPEAGFVGLVVSAAAVLVAGLAGLGGFLPALPALALASGTFVVALVLVSGSRRGWALVFGAALALAWGLAAGLGGLALLLPGLAALGSVGGLLARPGRLPKRAEANLWGWLYVLPAVLLLVVWHFAPAVYALWLSLFERANFIREAGFSGLENYAILLRDPLFWGALGNTAWYVAGTVPTGILLATLVAILLNERVRGQGALRTVFFLPYITALTAAAAVWKWIYNPEFGVLNALLGTAGQPWLDNPDRLFALLLRPLGLAVDGFLAGPSVALVSVMAMTVWHNVGYAVVILLAGLQSVPREYYEAASLDGASWWDQVRRITWPLLGPTTFFLAVTGLIGAFQVFTQVLVLTPGGGVLGDTTTIVKYLYDKGFRDSDFSYASAMAFALFVLVFALTLVQNRVLARRVTYDL